MIIPITCLVCPCAVWRAVVHALKYVFCYMAGAVLGQWFLFVRECVLDLS